MVKLYDEGIYLVNGTEIVPESEAAKVQALTGKAANKEEAMISHSLVLSRQQRHPEWKNSHCHMY